MKKTRVRGLLILLSVISAAQRFAHGGAIEETGSDPPAAAERIVQSIDDSKLRVLLEETLERNPRVARLAAEAAAAAQRAPQVKALPDPTASLTWFLMAPQTRVGPLRASVNISQSLPWFGALQLEEQAAMWDAAASRARVEAARLEVVTEARVLYHELQFLGAEDLLTRDDRATLEHYSELALARYASGVGLDQEVIKLQSEITRADSRLLEIAARRAAVVAQLNALRDRPQITPVIVAEASDRRAADLEFAELRRRALEARPEMAAAAAETEAASVRVRRSKKAYSPNLMVGLSYGFVGPRNDQAGRLNPPEGNGDDNLGVTAGISLPVWRAKLEAGVEEGAARRLAAEEAVREQTASIDAGLGDLAHRIALLEEQVRLYENVLIVQAQQSLMSAESAYAAGTVGALDLLDAERVRLQIRIAAARAEADLAIAYSRLEGVVGGPLGVMS